MTRTTTFTAAAMIAGIAVGTSAYADDQETVDLFAEHHHAQRVFRQL